MPARIYTRSGDGGDTGLFGGQRVSKDDPRVAAYGDVDELNSALGLARAHCDDADISALLERIQNRIFTVGADLATPEAAGETHDKSTVTRLNRAPAVELEGEIDRLESELQPLTRFILPGGSRLASYLHLARTVCRRAERKCVGLGHAESVNPEIVIHLNRLSDLLFVMARVANARAGVPDVQWEPDSTG
jgi:cob(I)alamin adenosyltransferase